MFSFVVVFVVLIEGDINGVSVGVKLLGFIVVVLNFFATVGTVFVMILKMLSLICVDDVVILLLFLLYVVRSKLLFWILVVLDGCDIIVLTFDITLYKLFSSVIFIVVVIECWCGLMWWGLVLVNIIIGYEFWMVCMSRVVFGLKDENTILRLGCVM